MTALQDRLPAYAGFAAVLSAAGLPIYIFAPKYYADSFGVSLASIGALLFVLRLFDVIQDPALGWVAERLGRFKPAAMTAAAMVMALAMVGLFCNTQLLPPLIWFAVTVTVLFSAFSFLTIGFYSQGVGKAAALYGGHVRLAAWRESGGLLGVCVAAVLPSALAVALEAPFPVYGVIFALAVLPAAWAMWPEWRPVGPARAATPPLAILRDRVARRLMILALVNAAPLAVSSTLFLFFVESRLDAAGWEGPLLVLFFLAAAVSAPLWGLLASKHGERRVLLSAMVLAVASFGVTLTLGAGDAPIFAVICILSGATIGADLTLLPALFARRMSVIAPNGGQGFGLWSFVNKFALAFAAVSLLPGLEAAGYRSGSGDEPASALMALTVLYSAVPSALKLVAIALLLATKREDIE